MIANSHVARKTSTTQYLRQHGAVPDGWLDRPESHGSRYSNRGFFAADARGIPVHTRRSTP